MFLYDKTNILEGSGIFEVDFAPSHGPANITILCLSYASSTLARMRPLMVVKINCGRGLFSGHPYSIFRVHWVLAPCCWSGQPDTIRITHTLSNYKEEDLGSFSECYVVLIEEL